MSVKIIGGKSMPRSVSIMSDEFTATAVSDKNGVISSQVKPHSRITRFVIRHNGFLMPKLFRLALLIADGIGIKDVAFFVGLAAIVVLLPSAGIVTSDNAALISGLLWALDLLILIVFGAIITKSIARWHGAEHMAIAAYCKSRLTDMETIRKQSRIDPYCGGRFFPVFIAAMMLSDYISKIYAPESPVPMFWFVLLVNAVLLEIILQVDARKNLGKLPVTAQISNFLQKYITTAPPGEQELRTAQQALIALVLAHNEHQ